MIEQYVIVGAGLATTIATGPAGLALMAYGARNLSVAKQKHKLLLAELSRRGIDPLKGTKRDIFIPLTISVACASIAPVLGPAMHAGVQHLAPAGTHLANAGLTTAHNAMVSHQIGQSASAATHGFVSGVTDAGSQLVHDIATSHAAPHVTQGICNFFSTHAATQCSVAANIIGHDVGQQAALGGAQLGLTSGGRAVVVKVSGLIDPKPV
jgi:hypothetical protein